MKSLFHVMGSVQPKISTQNIIESIRDVVRCVKMVVCFEASVMVVSVPAGSEVDQEHGNHKHHQRGRRIPRDEEAENEEIQHSHSEEVTSKLGMFASHAKRPVIPRYGNGERIFPGPHFLLIPSRPSRLVLRLIKVVKMMSEIVVKHPNVG